MLLYHIIPNDNRGCNRVTESRGAFVGKIPNLSTDYDSMVSPNGRLENVPFFDTIRTRRQRTWANQRLRRNFTIVALLPNFYKHDQNTQRLYISGTYRGDRRHRCPRRLTFACHSVNTLRRAPNVMHQQPQAVGTRRTYLSRHPQAIPRRKLFQRHYLC